MELEKWEGQIFTCSALKYAKEIKLSVHEKNKIGKLKKIIGKLQIHGKNILFTLLNQ